MNYLHDTHLHLDLYNKQMHEIITEIEDNGIQTIAVTNLPVLYEKLSRAISSDNIHVSLGFHPELVYEYQKYISLMWKYLDQVKYIGEVGLDIKYVSQDNRKCQLLFFSELVNRCSSIGGKVLSVHSRGSEKEVLEMIPFNYNGKIILHWFSGSIKSLKEAIAKDCFFSVNPQMLLSENGRKLINEIPLNKLLLESDGPFVKVNDKIITPIDIKHHAINLANYLKYDVIKLFKILNYNFAQLNNIS